VPARRVQRVAPSGTLEDACLGLHLWIAYLGVTGLECSGAGLFGVSMCCRNTWGVVSSSSWIFALIKLALKVILRQITHLTVVNADESHHLVHGLGSLQQPLVADVHAWDTPLL
jgi:hypothetical protein